MIRLVAKDSNAIVPIISFKELARRSVFMPTLGFNFLNPRLVIGRNFLKS